MFKTSNSPLLFCFAFRQCTIQDHDTFKFNILILLCYYYSYGVPFPVYLDLNCTLYHQLGLGHSVLILRIEAVCRYATKIVRKQPILPDYPGDDWFQMAGDFIVDDKGKLVFGHWGTDYNDRPSVSKILQELRVSEIDH